MELTNHIWLGSSEPIWASEQGGSDGNESSCNAGDTGSIPRWGRFPIYPYKNPTETSSMVWLIFPYLWSGEEMKA